MIYSLRKTNGRQLKPASESVGSPSRALCRSSLPGRNKLAIPRNGSGGLFESERDRLFIFRDRAGEVVMLQERIDHPITAKRFTSPGPFGPMAAGGDASRKGKSYRCSVLNS